MSLQWLMISSPTLTTCSTCGCGAAQIPNIGPSCGPSPYGRGRYFISVALGSSSWHLIPSFGHVVGIIQRPVGPNCLKCAPPILNVIHVSSAYGLSKPFTSMLGRNLKMETGFSQLAFGGNLLLRSLIDSELLKWTTVQIPANTKSFFA